MGAAAGPWRVPCSCSWGAVRALLSSQLFAALTTVNSCAGWIKPTSALSATGHARDLAPRTSAR
eukprot:5382811-Prymnesium_polylepis.2